MPCYGMIRHEVLVGCLVRVRWRGVSVLNGLRTHGRAGWIVSVRLVRRGPQDPRGQRALLVLPGRLVQLARPEDTRLSSSPSGLAEAWLSMI